MDDPMVLAPGVALSLDEVEVRVSRSSGPGGQHANVTSSRVEAVLDVAAARSLSAPVKERLVERLGPRPRAVAQDARSQLRNRELALARLRERLAGALVEPKRRRPTRVPRSATERRLEGKRRSGRLKAERRRPPLD
jgi:ribosome-associated protein